MVTDSTKLRIKRYWEVIGELSIFNATNPDVPRFILWQHCVLIEISSVHVLSTLRFALTLQFVGILVLLSGLKKRLV